MCRITVISPLQKGDIHLFQILRAGTVRGAFICICTPMLSAEWAWHKILIIPGPENSFLAFFERHSHAQNLIILSVAMKVRK